MLSEFNNRFNRNCDSKYSSGGKKLKRQLFILSLLNNKFNTCWNNLLSNELKSNVISNILSVFILDNILNSNKKIIELNEQIAVGNNNSQLVAKQLQESQSNYDKLLQESTKELNNFMDKSNNEKKYSIIMNISKVISIFFKGLYIAFKTVCISWILLTNSNNVIQLKKGWTFNSKIIKQILNI